MECEKNTFLHEFGYLDLSGNIYLLISCCLEKGLPGIVIVIVPLFYGFIGMLWNCHKGAFTNYVDKTKLGDNTGNFNSTYEDFFKTVKKLLTVC